MADDERKQSGTGNEPAPILLVGLAVLPVLGWLLGVFG
jgi:hypothetical protein